MNRCCSRFESCTTCPECGSRITRKRPAPLTGDQLDHKIERRRKREHDDPTVEPSFQEAFQDALYDTGDFDPDRTWRGWDEPS